jgi:CBS domain containing-hemolysin-like protein
MIAALVTVVLLVANGVFVAFEFSVVASRRARLGAFAPPGSRRLIAANRALDRLSRQLAGVQLGVTLASLGLGAVTEPALGGLLEKLTGHVLPHGAATIVGLALALGAVAFVHTVFGELVPRSLAMSSAEKVLLWLSVPLAGFIAVFGPVVALLNFVASGPLRLFGIERRDEVASRRSLEEIGALVARAAVEGTIERDDHQRVASAIAIVERTVDEIMLPRDQIVSLRRGVSVEDAEALFVSSGFSRLPVIGRDLDEVVGFVHAKDLLEVASASRTTALPIRSIRRMLVVAAHRQLPELLVSMRKSRLHVAVVVDADGRTAGLVTLEDLLEEMVGEITDETDR